MEKEQKYFQEEQENVVAEDVGIIKEQETSLFPKMPSLKHIQPHPNNPKLARHSLYRFCQVKIKTAAANFLHLMMRILIGFTKEIILLKMVKKTTN